MRRILAALAAVAMLAAGFLVRRSLDDPERGKEPLRLWCAPEAEAACRSIVAASVQVMTPKSMEKALLQDAPEVDAIITDPMWPARIASQGPRVVTTIPLASTPIVVVPSACSGKLNCLLKDQRVWLPSVSSGLVGPLVAGAAVAEKKLSPDQVESDPIISALKEAMNQRIPGTDGVPYVSLGTLLDVVVTTRAEFVDTAPAGRQAVDLTPKVDVRLELVSYVSDERITTLGNDLKASLKDAQWNVDGETARTYPSAELLNAVYKELS